MDDESWHLKLCNLIAEAPFGNDSTPVTVERTVDLRVDQIAQYTSFA
jgi:hypothetical protein